MPPFLYDLYWLLVLGIAVVIGMILFFGISVIVHRLNRNQYYHQRDQLRQRYEPLVTGLQPEAAIPEELKRLPGSMDWTVIEELLLKELGHATPPLQDHLIYSIERLGYVDWNIKQLNKGNRWQQAIVAEKLGQMQSRRSTDALIAVLDCPIPDIQMVAVRSLGILGGLAAAEHLIKKLYKISDAEQEISLRVLKPALIAFGSTIVPLLREGLHHESWRVRAAVVDILSEIADPGTIQDLRPALKDPEQDVRAKTARALGRLKDVQSVPLFIELLGDHSWVVRLQAARALGILAPPDAMAPLLSRMTDENWQVRAAAAEALRKYGDHSIRPLWKAITHSTDRYAREQFMEELQRSALLESCIDALSDSTSEATGWPSAVISEYVRHGITSLLIYHLKNHSSVTVRKRLLKLFGQHQSPRALDCIHWLSNNDPAPQVREMAQEILRRWVSVKSHHQESDAGTNR